MGASADFAATKRGRIELGTAAEIILPSGELKGLAQSPDACSVRQVISGGEVVWQG